MTQTKSSDRPCVILQNFSWVLQSQTSWLASHKWVDSSADNPFHASLFTNNSKLIFNLWASAPERLHKFSCGVKNQFQRFYLKINILSLAGKFSKYLKIFLRVEFFWIWHQICKYLFMFKRFFRESLKVCRTFLNIEECLWEQLAKHRSSRP